MRNQFDVPRHEPIDRATILSVRGAGHVESEETKIHFLAPPLQNAGQADYYPLVGSAR